MIAVGVVRVEHPLHCATRQRPPEHREIAVAIDDRGAEYLALKSDCLRHIANQEIEGQSAQRTAIVIGGHPRLLMRLPLADHGTPCCACVSYRRLSHRVTGTDRPGKQD